MTRAPGTCAARARSRNPGAAPAWRCVRTNGIGGSGKRGERPAVGAAAVHRCSHDHASPDPLRQVLPARLRGRVIVVGGLRVRRKEWDAHTSEETTFRWWHGRVGG